LPHRRDRRSPVGHISSWTILLTLIQLQFVLEIIFQSRRLKDSKFIIPMTGLLDRRLNRQFNFATISL
jgi:hypothetical protein